MRLMDEFFFLQALRNVPSTYATTFLLLSVMYPISQGKNGSQNEVNNIQEPRGALPSPFFPFGRRRGTFRFFSDFNDPNVFPPSYGYPAFESESIYKQ
jgi:hypothetical protein